MTIHVTCPECNRAYDVPDRYEGQKVRCKSCGGAISVPRTVAATNQETLDEPFPAMTTRRQPAKQADAAKTTSPLSGPAKWWLIGGAAVVLVATLAVSFLTPLGILIAIGLFGIGMVVLTVGQIMLIVTAFNEDTTQGLLVFFLPIYPLIYLFTRWPKTSLSVWLYAAGIGLSLLSIPTGLGGTAAIVNWAASYERDDDSPSSQPGNVGGPFGDVADQNAFPQPPDFDPRREIPPGSFPPGFMPPQSVPPGGYPPGGFPPGGFPPGAIPPQGFPPPDGFPHESMPANFGPGGGADANDDLPVPGTLYLRSPSSEFDPHSNHTAALEERLTDVDGYVTGSAAIDMSRGIVTFEATPRAATTILYALRDIGLRAGPRQSSVPWVDPTQPVTVSLKIISTQAEFDALPDHDDAVDEAMVHLEGYVPGSVSVDLDARTMTYEAYHGSRAERFPTATLLIVGVHTAPPKR